MVRATVAAFAAALLSLTPATGQLEYEVQQQDLHRRRMPEISTELQLTDNANLQGAMSVAVDSSFEDARPYVYVAAAGAGLTVVKINSGFSPKVAGSVAIGVDTAAEAENANVPVAFTVAERRTESRPRDAIFTASGPVAVAVHPIEPLVFVVGSPDHSIAVVDITVPDSPSVKALVKDTTWWEPGVDGLTPCGIVAAECSDSTAAQPIMHHGIRRAAIVVDAHGEFAYTLSGPFENRTLFTAWDLGDPATPTVVGFLYDQLARPRHMAVRGSFVYLPGYMDDSAPGRLTVINVTDPANPTIAGVGNFPKMSMPVHLALHPHSDLAFIACYGQPGLCASSRHPPHPRRQLPCSTHSHLPSLRLPPSYPPDSTQPHRHAHATRG